MKTKLKAGLALAALALGACTAAPDLTAIRAERARPAQRYDIAQALAANGNVVAAGTQSGAALVSTDRGRTWRRVPLAGASLIGLASCPDGSFVAIDFHHRVWSADAAGNDWRAVPLDRPRTPLAVTCDARGAWWIAGSGATLATSGDRGITWRVHDAKEDAQLTAIQFVDADAGYALGEFGIVLATEDGGLTWTPRPRLPGEFYPYAAVFASRSEGWASGLAGQILHTADGGKTWTRQDNATGAALYRLFLHRGAPVGVGAGGTVARPDGNTWRALAYPDAAPVFLGAGASLAAQDALVLGGPGALLRVIAAGSH